MSTISKPVPAKEKKIPRVKNDYIWSEKVKKKKKVYACINNF